MNVLKLALVPFLLSSVAASAATIDLSDGSFFNQTYDFAGPINYFEEHVDGVTFAFSASQFRGIGTWANGTTNASGPHSLSIGGGGGSTTSFTLVASEDVTLNSFSGLAQLYNTAPLFDVTGTGVSSTGNAFSTSGFLLSATPTANSFAGGILSLLAGEAYTFNITNVGAVTTGYLTGLDFTKSSTTAVPVPAALPLLLGGIGALGLATRRRRKSA